MAGALTGDFKALGALHGRLKRLATVGMKKKLGDLIAAAAIKQIADEFREERDPYGKAWQPLKVRKGKILRDTARLANSFRGKGTTNGFRISTNVEYAAPHQEGATIASRTQLGSSFVVNRRGRRVGARRASRLRTIDFSSGRFKSGRMKAHVRGAFTIPRRQMIPDASTGGVGPIWGAALNKEADAAMHLSFGNP